jgi:hypothetical protein
MDSNELEKQLKKALLAKMHEDEGFWLSQRVKIIGSLPERSILRPWRWGFALPALAASLLVSVAVWRQTEKRQVMELARDMDVVQNWELMEDLDLLENLETVEAL